jgi:tRNA(Arg) A34 adenosine deaminase TadA
MKSTGNGISARKIDRNANMTISSHCSFALPAWVGPFLASWQQPLLSTSLRMQLAIALSRESVRQKTGGPFGAVIVDEREGRLVSVGVNLVTTAGLSIAHAELVALSLAQTALGQWNLSHAGALQLVTSCEPCAMCFGALPWSGIRSLVCGARKKDAETAGFDEGDKPARWVKSLEQRGIDVQCGVLQKEAAAVLTYYRDIGGPIYNATHGHDET